MKEGKEEGKGRKKSFGGDEYVHFLNIGDGFMGVCTCANSPDCPLKYMQFFVCLILKDLPPSPPLPLCPSFLSFHIWKVQSSQENLPTSHNSELCPMTMPSCKGGLQLPFQSPCWGTKGQ